MSTTALMNYKEESARRAQEAMKVEYTSTGVISFVNGKNGWAIRAGDAEIGNTLLCFILANRRVNSWYVNNYNPDVQEAPACWSVFRRGEEAIAAPDSRCLSPQHNKCASCPKNVFGSARNGRGGKDCGNRRRLFILPAGGMDPKTGQWILSNAEQLAGAGIYSCSIPPTSAKNFSEFIRLCGNHYGRSTDTVVASMSIRPDNKTMFKVYFEPIPDYATPDDPEILGILNDKLQLAEQDIDFGFEVSTASEEQPGQKQAGTGRF